MHRLSSYVIVHRTQTNQTPNGIRLDGERNPIGRRTESDRTADGIRLDGERQRQGEVCQNSLTRKKSQSPGFHKPGLRDL